MEKQKLFSIGEVAEELDRVSHSIRIWFYRGIVPKHLEPIRDERGWRWWTAEQIDGFKIWMEEQDLRPGKGLPSIKNKK